LNARSTDFLLVRYADYNLGLVFTLLYSDDCITDLVQSIENVFSIFDSAVGDERRDGCEKILAIFWFKERLNEAVD